MVIGLIASVEPGEVSTTADIFGGLFNEDREHYYVAGNLFGKLARRLENEVPQKLHPDEALDEFLRLYDEVSPEGKVVAEFTFANWIAASNKFWNEQEWNQAKRWLQNHDYVDTGFANSIRLGLATRELAAHHLRKIPITEEIVANFEEAFKPYLSDASLPAPVRMGALRSLMYWARGGIRSPLVFDTYLALLESEEARGIPPFASEWAILVRAVMSEGVNPEQMTRLSEALEKSFVRNQTPGKLYQKVHPTSVLYRYYMEILSHDRKKTGIALAKDFSFSESDGFSYDMLLVYLQLGAYDLVEARLPDMTGSAVDEVSGIYWGRRFLPASQPLLNGLDQFHQSNSHEIDKLKMELALYKLCVNPTGSASRFGDTPLDRRLQKSYPKFKQLKDEVTDIERAAILALLDPAALPPADVLEGWHGWEVWKSLPANSAIAAKANLAVIAWQYGDEELWEQFVSMAKDLRRNELLTYNHYLTNAILADILRHRKEGSKQKAQFLQRYLKALMQNPARITSQKESSAIIPITYIASKYAGIPFPGKDIAGHQIAGLNRAIGKQLPIHILLRDARFYSKCFSDPTIREDIVVRLANYGVGNAKVSKTGLFTVDRYFCLFPKFIATAEHHNLVLKAHLDPGSKLVIALNQAKRVRNYRANGDRWMDQLKKAKAAIPPDNQDYEYHKVAADLVLAEFLIAQNRKPEAVPLISAAKNKSIGDATVWISRLEKRL